MKSLVSALGVVLSVSFGCASTPEPRGAGAPSEDAPGERRSPARQTSVAAPAPGDDQAVAASEASLAGEAGSASREERATAPELAIWSDPAFRLRLAESFLAESDVEPRLVPLEREAMQQVLAHLAEERTSEALDLLEKSRAGAGSALFDFTLANLCFQREDLDRASEAYGAAVSKHPKFLRAWRNLALVDVRRGELEEAARALTRTIELGGGDALVYGLLGYCHTRGENPVGAESAYRMANLLDPETADWKTGLARSFFEQKRFADAAALCGTLLEREPDRADLWLLQANAYVGLGLPLRAAENCAIVDRLGKSTAESLAIQGDIYVNEELFEPAVDCHVRALEKSRGAGHARAIRAAKVLTAKNALEASRRLIGRIEALSGAGLTSSDHKELLRLRARIAVAEGAGDEEARVLEEIVALDPLDGEALILLGQHARRRGDLERAVLWFERAAGIEASEADARVRHAQVLVAQGRYADAMPLLRRAQALKPRENIQQYLEQVERVSQAR